MNLDNNIIYVLDLILLIPPVWFFGYLFLGLVTLNGSNYQIGAPFCFLGFVWLALTILRITGELV